MSSAVAARAWPVGARAASAATLGLLLLGSLALRSGGLHGGYWIDEAISVGVASRPLLDIPHALAHDGSPPLYYALLHEWIALFGAGEVATRALSLSCALLAVPAAWWAGGALFDARAGLLAAAIAAGCPFLTYYGQETRMYSLVAVLSLLAATSFVLGFLRGRRGHVALLGVWLALLLYAHTWGVFLALAMAVGWLVLWRRGRVGGREGALLGAALALAYAPWVPTLLFQAAHTGAPWAQRPSPLALVPVLAVVAGWRFVRDEAVRALAGIAALTATLAWLYSQLDPAWTTRYLAVLFGPLVLAAAAAVPRGARWTTAALALIAAWALTGSAPAQSNVRDAVEDLGAALEPGDLVVSTQPEQVPALARYLPAGVRYLTPLGVPADPTVMDWRDALARLRAGRPLAPQLRHLAPGRRVLLVTPSGPPRSSAWDRAVAARTREWSATVRARLRAVASAVPAPAGARSPVTAELFEVSRPARR